MWEQKRAAALGRRPVSGLALAQGSEQARVKRGQVLALVQWEPVQVEWAQVLVLSELRVLSGTRVSAL